MIKFQIWAPVQFIKAIDPNNTPTPTSYSLHHHSKCFVLNFVSVQEVQEEGRYAIDSPGSPNAPEIPPEDYALRKLWKNQLATNETHQLIHRLLNE